MSLTAKSLNIADFAYLNIYLQWLIPLTIMQSLGLPLLANIYVSSNKISIKDYMVSSLDIILKLAIILVPIIFLVFTKIFGIGNSLFFSYIILLYGNIILFFQSQFLQSKKLIFESYLVSNYGKRGLLLSLCSCLILGYLYKYNYSISIFDIFVVITVGIFISIISSFFLLKQNMYTGVKSTAIDKKELISEGFKISTNSILNNSIFPMIFSISIIYLNENIVAKYQTNLRLLFLLLHFYQGILLSILTPQIYNLFSTNKVLLFNKVRRIMLNTLLYGIVIIFLFFLSYKAFIPLLFSSEFLIEPYELIKLSIIILVGIIFNIAFPLMNYSKLNKESLIVRILGILAGGIILLFSIYIFESFLTINSLLFTFFVMPNILAFTYWFKIMNSKSMNTND